jgi:hypothetical protein
MIDEHPVLLEATIFALAMLILPEIQILRPIVSIFGIGPLGPILKVITVIRVASDAD